MQSNFHKTENRSAEHQVFSHLQRGGGALKPLLLSSFSAPSELALHNTV